MNALITVSSLMFTFSIAGMWHVWQGDYRIDAAPAGSIILLVSAIVFIASLILFGVAVGMYIAGARP